MPRTTRFKSGDYVISTLAPGDLSNHRMAKGDIGRVYYDAFDECYYVRIIRSVKGISPFQVGAATSYRDEGVRRLTRADMVNVFQSEAQKALDDARYKLKLIMAYQRYATPEEELEDRLSEVMHDNATEQEIAYVIESLSFDIEPLESTFPKLENYVDDLENFK